MQRLSAALIIVAVCVVTAIGAQEPAKDVYAAGELHDHCKESGNFCAGFVMGMFLGTQFQIQPNGSVVFCAAGCAGMTNRVICAPTGFNSRQGVAIVQKHLAEHPKEWHEGAHMIVFRALERAFPCP